MLDEDDPGALAVTHAWKPTALGAKPSSTKLKPCAGNTQSAVTGLAGVLGDPGLAILHFKLFGFRIHGFRAKKCDRDMLRGYQIHWDYAGLCWDSVNLL